MVKSVKRQQADHLPAGISLAGGQAGHSLPSAIRMGKCWHSPTQFTLTVVKPTTCNELLKEPESSTPFVPLATARAYLGYFVHLCLYQDYNYRITRGDSMPEDLLLKNYLPHPEPVMKQVYHDNAARLYHF